MKKIEIVAVECQTSEGFVMPEHIPMPFITTNMPQAGTFHLPSLETIALVDLTKPIPMHVHYFIDPEDK